MGFKKKVIVASATAALSVAVAVPAMALENEFHGMYRLNSVIDNFNGDGPYDPAGKDKKAPTTAYFEQRARLMYIAKANDDLKLVTHFEIDSRWGDNSYNSNGKTRNNGGAIGADQTNLETKNIYLDFNIPKVPVNMKVGIQPYNDSFKGIMFDADMAGALATASYGKFTNSIGFFRFNDDGPNLAPKVAAGKRSRDMVALDVKYQAAANVKVGGAYYMINDDRNFAATPGFLNQQAGNTNITHTLGLNAETSFGPVTLDGFFVYQFGNLEAPVNRHISAFAGNVGARVKAGPGTARSEFLYISGDGGNQTSHTSNAFQSVNSVDTEHGFYNGDLQILFRDPYAMTTDNAIVYSSNNQDQGVVAGFIGYDMPFTPKLSATVNAGFAAVAKDNLHKPTNLKTGAANSSNYLGTEVSTHVDYKVYDNLTAIARGAYVILGDYYKGVALNGEDPRNPYMASIILNYVF
ncbi:membrane protein [Geobacter pickeringii]|uniref:Membrane protein n=1 Tax=Geobacter pickeringii TaxID=345632 RepID=A0A0B5BD48_9BACT|nr:membrane protein [Geobacter pickeringii]AJE04648.1 membrane protein [Geobacter pickeringii]